MDRSNFCGCKGVRTCIKCEKKFGYENKNIVEFTEHTYVYCPYCNKAWQGSNMNDYQSHPNHSGDSFDIGGVYIKEDFLSHAEADKVLTALDDLPWDKSQSGRRKQNFGPKCNFKRQKIKVGDFNGFPIGTKFIQDKFIGDKVLDNFQTIEQCTLEYDTENGSSIDNHIDDCWIWGERIVTVNILGDSVLTLTYYEGDSNKYNLNCGCYSYKKKYSNQNSNSPCKENSHSNIPSTEDKSISNSLSTTSNKIPTPNEESKETIPNPHLSVPLSKVIVRIPMPARSLLVLYGEARYEWLHCVLRSDVIGRRVCLAYREFTEPYLNKEETREVFEKAKCFF